MKSDVSTKQPQRHSKSSVPSWRARPPVGVIVQAVALAIAALGVPSLAFATESTSFYSLDNYFGRVFQPGKLVIQKLLPDREITEARNSNNELVARIAKLSNGSIVREVFEGSQTKLFARETSSPNTAKVTEVYDLKTGKPTVRESANQVEFFDESSGKLLGRCSYSAKATPSGEVVADVYDSEQAWNIIARERYDISLAKTHVEHLFYDKKKSRLEPAFKADLAAMPEINLYTLASTCHTVLAEMIREKKEIALSSDPAQIMRPSWKTTLHKMLTLDLSDMNPNLNLHTSAATGSMIAPNSNIALPGEGIRRGVNRSPSAQFTLGEQ